MPPEPAPVFLLLAAVVVVDFLCLTVPPEERGATAFVGDLEEDPTFVELGEAGFINNIS